MNNSMHATNASADGSRRSTHRRRAGRVLIVALLVLMGITVAAFATARKYASNVEQTVNDNLHRADQLPAETPTEKGAKPRPPKQAVAEDAVNVLVIGSDSRSAKAGEGRSDALMIVHLAGDRRSAQIISFPRDMYVDVPGHGKDKINAAYAYGGPKLAVRTVEGLTGTRMDHVAVIDFEGFKDVTTALGGVTVHNEHASKSRGYTFPKGEITIQGEEALVFVRERYDLPRGDLDRAERQRLVTQAILRKALSPEVMGNPSEFTAFVAAFSRAMTVDDALTPATVRQIALSLRMTGDDVAHIQAPISGFGTSPNGASIDIVDQQGMRELGKALAADDMARYVSAHPEQ